MPRFIQLLYVPGPSETVMIWGLDPNGEIWECDYRRDGRPLTWQRLEFGKPAYVGVSSRQNERVTGAEQFRADVLQHLRIFQNTAKGSERMAICDLISEIEKLDILEALGLK